MIAWRVSAPTVIPWRTHRGTVNFQHRITGLICTMVNHLYAFEIFTVACELAE